MRSYRQLKFGRVGPGPACVRWRRVVWPAFVVAFLSGTTLSHAQARYDLSDEPLTATAISEQDITLQARYVRQWRQDDGTLALLFQGGFQLSIGQRQLSARDAVVWITSRRTEQGRPFHELTIYLAENAEVREPVGTVTTDNVLLVRGVRTFGQLIKQQDAHVPDPVETHPLYQQALRDRALIEQGEPSEADVRPDIARPAEARRPRSPRSPRRIYFRLPNVEPVQTPSGEKAFVATGRVYLAQEGGPDAAMVEIQADNAVVFPVEDYQQRLFDDEQDQEEAPAEPPNEPTRPPRRPNEDDSPPQPPGLIGLGSSSAPASVRAVYLEGDVVLSMGNRFVRAHRLYYDFERERALILDAVMRAELPERGIPFYLRADEIRQLSAREFSADNAMVSTSEFYTPSYHVGAEQVVIRDATTRDTQGRATSPIAGNYELKNTTLNVGGVPLLWWPYSKGTLQESETLIRGIRTGYSGDFGAEIETKWYLFNLLGMQPPEGYDARLRADYFSKRGPALGLDLDYERESHFGLFRGYYIHDDGEDNLGPLRRRQEAPETSERGRVLWRHRHYLPDDWEATFEVSWISDPHFLEEYETSEFREGKEQETLVYLKRTGEVDAITLLANWRLLDFVTQTEHLPELAYRRLGDTFLDPFVLYHESRIGAVRRRTANLDANGLPFWLYENRYTGFPGRRGGATDVMFRGDVRQEAELPIKAGPVNIVPFASVRGTYWDSQPRDDGGLWRGIGVYGVRGSTSFSRVYDDIESELLDIYRIRHIIQPDFAAWWAHSNTRSSEITPLDYGIETIDSFYGFTAGIRQNWQTKRGPADARRTVDLLRLNVEIGAFGNTDGRDDISNGYANPLRPENSRPRNYLAGDLIYRLSDTTSLLYDFNVDLNDWSFDRHNVSLAVERSPRLAYVVGARYAGDIDMNLVGGGWNYRLSEKHITSVRGWWDLEEQDLGEVAVAYVRKLPRWYVGLAFEYDNIEDDFTISLSVWPEGIPEWTLGSRRFTGLATTTGIRP